jgi:hypothetical protein
MNDNSIIKNQETGDSHTLALSRALQFAEATIRSVAISVTEAYRQFTPILKQPALAGIARKRLEEALATIAFYHEQTGHGPDRFLAWPDRDLAVADALGDVLGCGQQCLCSACRHELERALALVELGIDDTEETP